jgi:hypothetical protein
MSPRLWVTVLVLGACVWALLAFLLSLAFL